MQNRAEGTAAPAGTGFRGPIFALSDRNPQMLRSLQALFSHGRLAGTGYMSILPVDQGIEHSAGAALPRTPIILTRKTS